jgi:hypothetical protein
MKHTLFVCVMLILTTTHIDAQVEPDAGKWATWFISSVEQYRSAAPPSDKKEVNQVLAIQKELTADAREKILYWNAGAPGHRWYLMASKLMMTDLQGKGALVNMLVSASIYDGTIAAWDTKYRFKRPRPYDMDTRIKALLPKAESPSYPCEYSVAAGVATTIISHYYPSLADSVKRMAQTIMDSRVAAGLAFPSDTQAGFQMGKKIAVEEIEVTKDYLTTKKWDGTLPQRPGVWSGKNPMLPMAGHNKTVVLDSASEFRPTAPPDFTAEMEELKNFKQTFRSQANAWHYASQATHDDLISRKVMEYKLDANPPRAARLYAAVNIAYYDGVTACFDAKYTYWGIRPDQYDSTYTPLFPSPPFPGYPSGHAMMSGIVGEIFPYFFPLEKDQFRKIAEDGAESRFHAGIHFRSDNNAGLELGKKIGAKVVRKISGDGADDRTKAIHVVDGRK